MKTLKPVAILLVIIMALVWVRTCSLQRHHYLEAERYRLEGNEKLALREYDAAMHFYTPWSPYIKKSAMELWSLGEGFERVGKPDWALIAYASIRSSFYASRSLYTPGRGWIERCDEKLTALNASFLLQKGNVNDSKVKSEEEKYLSVLKADRAPDVLWTLLAEVGFFGWVGSMVFMVIMTFDRKVTLRKRHITFGIVSFVFLFALWVVALLKA